MKIVVAKTAGFCMGVRRAVDMVLDASNLSREPIYTYGSLIHNPQVLAMLEEKKIFRIDKIPEKGSGVVLIRAHGVPPEDEKALRDAGFTVINATCPRVVRVQVIINEYARKGYSTIIIGDEKHPEVVGLLGYAKGKGHTITSMEQLCALPRFEAAVIVAQTTQNKVFYDEIKTWCKTNAPHYKIFDTICGSTEKRQAEIRKLAGENDAVIVVGGMQSGNTKRLTQIASGTGKFVQSELRNQLLSRKIIAIPAETYDLKVGLDMAKNQNLTYVMKINIIEWENNATEWTGEPDVASVNADLYATKTGYLVATASQKEAGSQAAITSGKPDRFVPTMITGLLNTLFP